jgi:hypothetical protein
MEKGIVLESWKSISAHLHRNIRTCQHWEREHGLPIHRLDGSPKAHVFAYTGELDAWLEERLNKPKPADAPPKGRERARSLSSLPGWNKGLIAILSVVAVAAVAASARLFWLQSRSRWAETVAIPKITELMKAQDNKAALGLAIRAEKYIPGSAKLNQLFAVLCGTLLVETDPPGATVLMGPLQTGPAAWKNLGISPVLAKRICKGTWRWKAEKPGYETAEGTVAILAGAFNKLQVSLNKKG